MTSNSSNRRDQSLSAEPKAFEEPSISAPAELVNPAAGSPMMAMVGGSGGGPSADGTGLPPDGTSGAWLDGQADGNPGVGTSNGLGAD